MGAVAEEVKSAWSFVLNQIRNGDNNWDQVTKFVEDTVNVITVLKIQTPRSLMLSAT